MKNWVPILATFCVVSCTSSGPPPTSKSGTGLTSPTTPAVPSAPGATVAGNGSAPTVVSKSSQGFRWAGTVAAGKKVWLRNLNGSIEVEGSAGNRVEVTAKVRGSGSGSQPTIKVVPHDGTITVCVLWPSTSSKCGPRGAYSHGHVSGSHASVELRVKLPKGILLDLSTVNGGLVARNIQAAIKARSVNGSLAIDSLGPADLKSVNGRIKVTVKRGPLTAATVNGSIHARVPKQLDRSQMKLRTVNGAVSVVN